MSVSSAGTAVAAVLAAAAVEASCEACQCAAAAVRSSHEGGSAKEGRAEVVRLKAAVDALQRRVGLPLQQPDSGQSGRGGQPAGDDPVRQADRVHAAGADHDVGDPGAAG